MIGANTAGIITGMTDFSLFGNGAMGQLIGKAVCSGSLFVQVEVPIIAVRVNAALPYPAIISLTYSSPKQISSMILFVLKLIGTITCLGTILDAIVSPWFINSATVQAGRGS